MPIGIYWCDRHPDRRSRGGRWGAEGKTRHLGCVSEVKINSDRQAMPPAEEEEQGVFDDDEELDDSEGDDSDMDEDDDEDEVSPPASSAQPPLIIKEELHPVLTLTLIMPTSWHLRRPLRITERSQRFPFL
ncbi:hypothetical protein HPP92_001949 [Vanilla planifolia]|uniref:Uncharacterized protein n=1 Tax=Vanilla planifolia TaxID=51239 RepID=A0A835VHF3_VANPL|nr:hypothetical protein HPP92_001949 [Vanilla planifolia]